MEAVLALAGAALVALAFAVPYRRLVVLVLVPGLVLLGVAGGRALVQLGSAQTARAVEAESEDELADVPTEGGSTEDGADVDVEPAVTLTSDDDVPPCLEATGADLGWYGVSFRVEDDLTSFDVRLAGLRGARQVGETIVVPPTNPGGTIPLSGFSPWPPGGSPLARSRFTSWRDRVRTSETTPRSGDTGLALVHLRFRDGPGRVRLGRAVATWETVDGDAGEVTLALGERFRVDETCSP